jgi:hypothetical protein
MARDTGSPRQFQALFKEAIPFRATAQTLTALAGAETTVAITVPGAALGDIVIGSSNVTVGSGNLTFEVSAADTVSATLSNATGSTITNVSTVQGVVLKPATLITGS